MNALNLLVNLPNFFGVNVTARSTISIGVVRHKMYLTDSRRISKKSKKNGMIVNDKAGASVTLSVALQTRDKDIN